MPKIIVEHRHNWQQVLATTSSFELEIQTKAYLNVWQHFVAKNSTRNVMQKEEAKEAAKAKEQHRVAHVDVQTPLRC